MKRKISLILSVGMIAASLSTSVFAQTLLSDAQNAKHYEANDSFALEETLRTNGIRELEVTEGTLDADDIQGVIDQYFEIRGQSFLSAKPAQRKTAMYVMDRSVQQNELLRADALKGMQAEHGLTYEKVESIPYVRSAFMQDDNLACLDVYEWNWIEYRDGDSSITDVMGYSNDHTILMEKDGAAWRVAADRYEELPSTAELSAWNDAVLAMPMMDERAASFVDIVDDICAVRKEADPESREMAISHVMRSASLDYTDYLDVEAIIEYADRYVPHFYESGDNGMMHPSYYNKEYDLKGESDCQNYVSQCLYEGGGIDMTARWYFNGGASDVWCNVTEFHDYWTGQGVTSQNVRSGGSNIYPGNPVYYLKGNNRGHTSICVGYNSAGTPIIDAHNRDMFHMTYGMAGSSQFTQKTLLFTTDDTYWYNPGYCENLGTISGSGTQTFSTEIDPDTPEWVKFKITSAGNYRIYSSTYGSNSGIDLKATLYKDQEQSGGKTLYMIEKGFDDDSGSGTHFSISEYLSAGTYFLRVQGVGSNDYGLYKINIQK